MQMRFPIKITREKHHLYATETLCIYKKVEFSLSDLEGSAVGSEFQKETLKSPESSHFFW